MPRRHTIRRAHGLWLVLALLPLLGHRGAAQAPPTETLTFAPVADTYVDSGLPTTNFNTDPRLRARAPAARISYLRFVVGGVGGRRVQQARLRLEVTGAAASGGALHRIGSTTWDEATLTYNTRPAIDGPALATLGAVGLGTVVEFALDTTVTADGSYNFAIDSQSTDGVTYNSSAATTGLKPALVLVVANTPPTVAITQPPDASSFYAGDPITLQGQARDGGGGDLSARIAWRSDLAGALGTGPVVTALLGQGTHTVTAAVTDDHGQSASSHIGLDVTARPPRNTEPLVAITAPSAGRMLAAGVPVAFTGTADDLEDGPLTPGLAWTSDRDGPLGAGGAFTHALTQGTHQIAASVTDSGGLRGLATVTADVHAAGTRSVAAVADASVDAGAPDANAGTSPSLHVDASHLSYLRFAVSGIGTRPVARALLRLQVDDAPDAGSDSGGRVRVIAPGSWEESAVTYATRPAADGPVLASAGAVLPGARVDVDVTAAVPGDGIFDFALGSPSADQTTYRSREGGPAPALVLVLADDPPAVTITDPAEGAVVFAGSALALYAQATDAEDGDLSSALAWSSSMDGPLGTGASLTTSALRTGIHTITAAATDADGLSGDAQRTVRVRPLNAAPVVTITAPTDGSTVPAGSTVTLAAGAHDDFDGDIGSRLRWTSSRDGALGSGARLVVALSAGTHVLATSVTDTDGLTATATATVTAVVRAANVLPVVALVVPVDGATVLAGKPLLLAASATDAEDGNLGAALRWTSSRDGALGSGARLVVPGLSAGTHVLTATVTDRDGGTAGASRTVTVVPATVSFGALADTYVDAASASSKFGTATSLLAGTSPVRQAFLRFAVTGTAAFTVEQALLRLTVGAGSGDNSTAGGTVRTISSTTWSEATTTYGTRPALDGPVLATRGAVALRQVVDFDVTAAVRGDATYNFGLVSTATDWVRYASREAAAGRPALVVTRGQNTAPLVTITAPASGTRVLPTSPVTLAGTAVDAESGDLGAQLAWRSDRDGALGTGAALTIATLTPGRHAITARVTDAGGQIGEATITLDVAHPPVVTITAPDDGAIVFTSALPLTLQGQATDAEDGTLSSQLEWRSDRDGALARGATVSIAALSVGTHTITAAVTDDDGLRAEARLVLRVRAPNQPPALTITAPADRTSVPAGTAVTLAAGVTDDFDPDLATRVQWRSSRDGALGTGAARTVALSEGSHTLTAAVTDSDGAVATAAIDLTVTPTAPVVTITAPAAGATVFAGSALGCAGSALDATDGLLSPVLRWVSDRDGTIGTGAGFTTTLLSIGTHVVTASVTDAGGLGGQAQRTVVVRPPNVPPAVTILAPENGAPLLAGRPVLLGARAIDREDGDLGAAVRWTSSRDGALNIGGTLVVPGLSAGTHALTATVTDRDGAATSATVTVTVAPSALAFTPVADTYVDSGKPTTKFGTATGLLAGSSPTRQAFLRFTVSGIGRFAVQQARLRLTAGASSSDGSLAGGTLRATSNTSWSEGTTTYNTRPAIDGAVLASAGKVLPQGVVDFDLTAAVVTDATYNLALTSASTDWVRYMSREATTGKPELLVTLTQNTAPLVTVTAPASGTTVIRGTVVTFAATATDAQSGDLGSLVTWRSDRDGPLGSGPTLAVATLSAGVHLVTAQVTDAGGLGAQSTIAVRVDAPPTLTIIAPASGAEFVPGAGVSLRASASDFEDGVLSPAITWTSDLDGPLGSGGALTVNRLASGVHTVTAAVADSRGQSASARLVLVVNGLPTLTITSPMTSPMTGALFAPGDTIPLAATATDPEDGDLTAAIAWTSSLDGPLGTGGTLAVTSLRSGTHVVTATVTDARGKRASASRTVVVDAAPVIQMAAPADGATFLRGTPVTFSATATDLEDGSLSAKITWASDLDGPLGRGGTVVARLLRSGIHRVTASVSDASGRDTAAQVAIMVDAAPVVRIAAPGSGATFLPGAPVELVATAADAEDGPLTDAVAWTSDRDGALGTGGTVTVTRLRSGTHTITASVTDSNGKTASDHVAVVVNAPPVVTIIAPTDGSSFVPGEVVGLRASAYDLEDGDLDAAIGWTSSLDGSLGAGSALDVGSLRSGTHTMVASVTDARGERASARVTVIVNAIPVLAISAPADGAVYAPGEPVALAATATDLEDGDLGAAIVWTSSLDGSVGTGAMLATRTLRSGTHVLTATVTDRGGKQASARVGVVVNAAPTIAVDAPTDGAIYTPGDPVPLLATATDLEDGDLGDAILWTSSLAGPLGGGRTLRIDTLRAGTHVLTAAVADRGGKQASAHVTVVVDTAPALAISAPLDGAVYAPGDPVELAATATDAEDGNLGAAVVWSSSLQGRLGTGGALTVGTLRSGAHVLTATVVDHDGRQTSAHVTVVVNGAPTITITAPAGPTSITPGDTLGLAATASDPEDGNLGAGVTWASSLDGALGTGAVLAVDTLRSGTHVLTATVTDHGGKQASASVSVTVDATPTVTITAPADGAVYVPGEPVPLAAAATDLEDGDLGDAILWTSDLDGALGAGRAPGATGLGSGTHIITALVRDHTGKAGSAHVHVVVNAAPTVIITAPADGSVRAPGDAVALAATATDPEDGDLGAAIVWTSSLDGALGTGAQLAVGSLRSGAHVITAAVTDRGGKQASAQVGVVVNATPTIAISAPADGTRTAPGSVVTLAATASDTEDGDLGNVIAWTSSLDGPLGSGRTLPVGTLRLGLHTVTAAVADAAGVPASASIAVLVDTAPAVSVLSPASGTVVQPGSPVELRAGATDAEEGDLGARVAWSSSLDGPLGTGAILTVAGLRSGTHVVTASVGDTFGVTAVAHITLVANAAPLVAITAPADGAAFAYDQPAVLTANASDAEDGDLGATIAWSSSLDGPLGTGPTVTPGLRTGTHVVTARVTDAGGTSATATITVVKAPLIILAGPYTTAYNNDFLLAKTRFDATAAIFFAGPTNLYPIDVEGGAGVVFRGGNVRGQYDRTWSWTQMHDLNNAAIAFNNSDFTVDGLRADNVTDGIRPRKGGTFTIRNVHLSYVRDDCIENDHVQDGLLDDSLLDGCFNAFSARPSAAIIDSGFDGSDKVWTIQNSLVRVQAMPGPRSPSADNLGYNGFFKWHLWDDPTASLSPMVALHNNVFMADRVGQAGADRMGIPPGKLASCSNNVMVWLGPGNYPSALPSCFTVTSDRTVWDNAVAGWLARHPDVPE